jgi:hypothetical protein
MFGYKATKAPLNEAAQAHAKKEIEGPFGALEKKWKEIKLWKLMNEF